MKNNKIIVNLKSGLIVGQRRIVEGTVIEN